MHPLLQLVGMAMVLCAFIVIQIYAILFFLVRRTGGSVKSDAILVTVGVVLALFAFGAAFIYL